jgi:hypothetical protein
MVKVTPACGWSPAPSAACLRVLVISMAPVSWESTNRHVTVSPADSSMASTLLPSSQVAESRFQLSGTVSAASYVTGLRSANVRESTPASPGPDVVSVQLAGSSVFDVKSNEPSPVTVSFSMTIDPREFDEYTEDKMRQ